MIETEAMLIVAMGSYRGREWERREAVDVDEEIFGSHKKNSSATSTSNPVQ